MNIIDKIVVKDGINADVTIDLGYFTNQVSEVNSAVSSLSASRGVINYTISGGKPTFNFTPFGNNELWVYVDGLGTKANGVTNSKQPTPFLFAPDSIGNKDLDIPSATGISKDIIIKRYSNNNAYTVYIDNRTLPENEVYTIINASSPFGISDTINSVELVLVHDGQFIGYLSEYGNITLEVKDGNFGNHSYSIRLMRVGDNIYIL